MLQRACCHHATVLTAALPIGSQRLGRFAWWGCAAWGSEVALLWAGLKSLATPQVRRLSV